MRLPGSRSVWHLPAAVLHTLTPPLFDRFEPRTEPGRRDHVAGRMASFEVRGASGPEGETRCRALEEALGRHPGVAWARVNAPLRRVLIGLVDSAPTADELAAAVRQVEGVTAEPSVDLLPGGFTGPVRRSGMALAADAAALALASVGRLSRWASLPAELASLVTLVDTQPRLRCQLERVLGQDNADLALAVANAAALGLTQGYVSLGTDVAHRLLALDAARARRDAFAAVADELLGRPEWAGARPVVVERPRPLPAGPIEHYADVAVLGGLAAGAAAAGLTRAPRRAAALALTALPRSTRLGREGFALQLTRVLARRGAQVMSPAALRLLDRVDTVVVDHDVLVSGQHTIGDIVSLPGADPSEVAVRSHALFRPADATARVSRDGWTLGPVERLAIRGRTGVRERRRLAAAGAVTVLGLAHGTRLMALVGLVPERVEASEQFLAACRRSGCAVFVAGGPEGEPSGRTPWDGWAEFQHAPGGTRLVATVRGLQAERGGVLVVSRQRAAVGCADCGVGVAGPDGSPAWGAHVLVGNDLLAAGLVVEAAGVASRVSRHAVRLAELGTGTAALVALTGAGEALAARAQLMVTVAAAAALGEGAWAARELGRRPVPPTIPHIPWHVLPPEACLDRLGSTRRGLSAGQVAQRQVGETSVSVNAPGLARAFAAELANPLTPVLLGGAALSASTGSVLDSGLVVSVAVGSALIGAVQRLRADRALARLFAVSAIPALVRRDGADVELTADDLVAGDVLTLGPGDVVPADCRLLSAEALEVDESSLTGESLPVAKSPKPVAARDLAERTCMVFQGTTVAAGRATALVVATGNATEAGRGLAAAAEPARPVGVQARLAAITDLTVPVALGAAGTLLLSGLVRGLPIRNTLSAGVALAVAAVPEGLPFLATAAQLSSARRLAGRGALVRNPRTIETLGRVDVLCFDKTGTLTKGKIRLTAVSDGFRSRPLADLDGTGRQVVAVGLRATPDDQHRKLPHPTDRAVVKGAAAAGVGRAPDGREWSPLTTLPFDPSRSYHACLGQLGAATLLSVKGAPEVVLPRCTHRRTSRRTQPLDVRGQARLAREHHRLAAAGYRVLAVAERRVAATGPAARRQLADDDVAGLVFLGFLALSDPVRDTATPSLDQLRAAGVQIIMITGDHPSTARTIAAELGVLDGDAQMVTGAELDAMADAELDAMLPRVAVVARGTPAHKVRVVEAFQRLGRTVAMTGDGDNDAPAIRLADVGIALGKRGTPAARAAADVIITENRLDAILAVLVEGRSMWASVRKALGIFVGGNLGEIAFTLLGSLATGRSPLSARQLLLVNLLTDLAPGLAVALRPPDPEASGRLLGEGPERSLGSPLNAEIAVRATATTLAAAGAWIAARLTGRRRRADTVGLAALVGSQLGQTLLVGGRSRMVILSSLVSAVVLAAVVQVPELSHFFGCTPLSAAGWTIAVAASAAATLLSFLLQRRTERLLQRRTERPVPARADLTEILHGLARVPRAAVRTSTAGPVPAPAGRGAG
ncbi:HAD-IC family P-type ATPase [Frankia sp. Mgl5]|uniref:cation-translocating P-type ATPase n=1 Tax=Frankia sp. Mgl5 TaxID=2933793 RepID=UPI00200F4FE9|nr:HAD-IC family P-type ATPase [Frankia sp. Mgl5]MCK9929056.1 HAD-IC family P-type ATPase [Frankia sp. Mgl5]